MKFALTIAVLALTGCMGKTAAPIGQTEGPVRAGQTTDNGFEALNFLQSESQGLAALDHSIAGSDTAWDRLLLWRDANHNGISEPDELTRVVDSPLTSVDLHYEVVSRVRKTNEIRERSTVLWDGATRQIVDVWLTILR